MTGRPEILFLSHRIPYPPDKGDKIRSWRLFEHLTKTYDVHLACFVDDKRDLVHTAFLRQHCASATFITLNPLSAKLRSARGLVSGRPLSFAYYHDGKMAKAVEDIRARALAGEIAFSSSMAPYIERPCGDRLRVVDFCDADSEKWRAYADKQRGPMRMVYQREARVLGRAETDIANWADHSFAITNEEAALFNDRAGARGHVDWWRNGVDTAYFDPALDFDPAAPVSDVVFVGAMDYRANVESVLHFAAAVWPAIRAKNPAASFVIVGSNPAASIKNLANKDGIIVTGRVDDVRPWLKRARVVVAPLRVGRGIQNKVLEAMAMARPVVASPAAAAGIICEDGEDVIIAATAKEMAEQICLLLNDEQKSRALGAAARSRMVNEYNWTAQLKRFDVCLETIALQKDYASSSSAPSSRPSLSPSAIVN